MSHRRRLPAWILAFAASLAFACAPALADVEPDNNMQFGAEGPLLTAGPWTGNVTATALEDHVYADADWYAFYVTGPAQIDVPLSAGDSGCATANLQNDDASITTSAFAYQGNAGDLQATAPAGTTRWFVQILNGNPDCAGDYTFTVNVTGGQLADGPAFPVTQVTAGANSADDAFGPLRTAITYQGMIGSDDDDDWLYLYTAAGRHPVDVQVINGDQGCELWWAIDDHNADDETEDEPFATGREVDASTSDDLQFTSPQAATRYDIDLSGTCSPMNWQVHVSAPDGVVTTSPPPAPPSGPGSQSHDPSSTSGGGAGGGSTLSKAACAKARHALLAARARRDRARHALLAHATHARHHRAAVQLRAARRAVRALTRRVHLRCGAG